MENGRVTLKAIAQRAGVSIGTADRALHHRAGVSEESCRRVREAAEQLGYRPNRFASALGRKRALRIGMVFPDQPADFFCEIERGIARAGEELRDYGVELARIRFPLPDAAGTARCLHSLVSGGYDGLAVCAAGFAHADALDALACAGIPLVTFNTDAPGSRRLFYIGSNARESGRTAAELLSMLLGGEGLIAVVGNFTRTMPFLERFGGFMDYMQSEAPRVSVCPCMECRGDPGAVYESLSALLARETGLRGVFCTGYTSTLGAAAALKRLGRSDIRMIGYDLTPETADALRTGYCDMLLYQDPFEQGYQAARLTARHVLENWLPPRAQLFLDTQLVVRSNMESCQSRLPELFGRM